MTRIIALLAGFAALLLAAPVTAQPRSPDEHAPYGDYEYILDDRARATEITERLSRE